MRYDGIGMGGSDGAIAVIVIFSLIAFLMVGFLHRRFPKLIERAVGGIVGIAITGFWLIITGLVVVAISVPVAGALGLDREGQIVSWAFIAGGLYLIGRRLK